MDQKTFHKILQEMLPNIIENSNYLKDLKFKFRSQYPDSIEFVTPYAPIDTSNPYYVPRINKYLNEHPDAKDFKSDLSILMFRKLETKKSYGSDAQKLGSVLSLYKGLGFKYKFSNIKTGFKNKEFVIKFNRNIITIEEIDSDTHDLDTLHTLNLTGISREQLLSSDNPLTPILTQIIESWFREISAQIVKSAQ